MEKFNNFEDVLEIIFLEDFSNETIKVPIRKFKKKVKRTKPGLKFTPKKKRLFGAAIHRISSKKSFLLSQRNKTRR